MIWDSKSTSTYSTLLLGSVSGLWLLSEDNTKGSYMNSRTKRMLVKKSIMKLYYIIIMNRIFPPFCDHLQHLCQLFSSRGWKCYQSSLFQYIIFSLFLQCCIKQVTVYVHNSLFNSFCTGKSRPITQLCKQRGLVEVQLLAICKLALGGGGWSVTHTDHLPLGNIQHLLYKTLGWAPQDQFGWHGKSDRRQDLIPEPSSLQQVTYRPCNPGCRFLEERNILCLLFITHADDLSSVLLMVQGDTKKWELLKNPTKIEEI